MSQSDPVIEAEYLAQLPLYLLLDARGTSTDRNDLIDGAVIVPVEGWVDAARRDATSFDNVDYWGEEFAKLGLSSQTMAVVFDDGLMTEAARVWFILQFFGAKALVLNGGTASLATERASIPVPTPQNTMPFQASYNAGPVGLVDRHTLKDNLDTTTIFDARTQAEFKGKDLKSNARGGHLPGAKLLPHSDLLKSGNLRSPSDSREMLSAIGFQTGDHLVTHCDGGGRAALAAIAAVRAGYEDVDVYYLSFSDWAKNESCPVK
ncbi:rhodanese-like domain-containing protein [Mesorhizobium sp. YIM 152430]|uniref:sulfurtransferase n=1 Tax=Mesorhizobium sp. YIM 152430 TaxID=3031761 RepID=UPI0023DACE2E|nr:rhodanese-like domain-containing protein [Mesorhizobium sp. YIM 152430]MDF1600186.1 rhodanese-like domain-containing protein [Mesorhizobium sp. YIM 152430]